MSNAAARYRALLVAALLLAALAALALASAPRARAVARDAPAGPPAVTAPAAGALYTDGPDGRYLLGGAWLFRLDPQDTGIQSGLPASTSTDGWTTVSVPNAWNANDTSQASMDGTVAWYRKDFLLPDPSAALSWIVRFESVNFRARVWLNGTEIGSHVGGYLPFELPLGGAVARQGVNHLVVRVDNRRDDAGGTQPVPAVGWWNYGGLLREVYLRRVNRLDVANLSVRTTPGCARCAARVDVAARVSNVSGSPLTVALAGGYGSTPIDLGRHRLGAHRSLTFRGSARIAHPKLWGPGHPALYRLRLLARTGSGPPLAGYTVLSGIRTIVVKNGRLLLNGRPQRLRGVAIHEDAPGEGAALGPDDRARTIALAQDVGADLIRAHYPLHPALEELADRAGILLWNEVPVYQLSDQQLGRPAIRGLALAEVHDDVIANRLHPAVMSWSIANELPPSAGRQQISYIGQAAALVRRLDATRPVALAFQVRPSSGCQQAYKPIDLLGVNDYFGWYTGVQGEIADRDSLSSYLDAIRACYPHQALAITEFGAEANRQGPVDEKGTYAFQSDYIGFHLGVYDSKPWLSGSVYFTLQEFRVRPGWDGGNPRPDPPLHEKAVVTYAGVKKPGYFVLRRIYRAAAQLSP